MGVTDVLTAGVALFSLAAEQRDAPPAVANLFCRFTPQHELVRLASSTRFRLRAQEQQPGRD
jgi:hypothetical protein